MTKESVRRVKSFVTLLAVHIAVVVLGALAAQLSAPSFTEFIVSLGARTLVANVVSNLLYQAVAYGLNKLSLKDVNGGDKAVLNHEDTPALI